MPQIKPSSPAERPDENPYAPPREEIRPSVNEIATDQVVNQRTKHLRRESCIRLSGLIGLILAGFVGLTFGVGSLFELYRQERRYRAVERSALGRPNDLRHLNRRPRIRHELGFVPATELGSVGSDYRDDATTSGSRLRLAIAEPNCKPRS